MRKAVITILGVFVLLTGSIYFFIPGKINITDYTAVNATANGTYRVLSDTGKWAGWWPKDLNNYTYTLSEKLYNAIKVSIRNNTTQFSSKIGILPLPGDSALLQWESTLTTGFNPFKRLIRYRQAIQVKNNMTVILKRLQFFLNKNENIYGYPIRQVIVKDSFLLFIAKTLPHYPRTNEIYVLIGQLQHYASKHGATNTNYPMLNIRPLDNHLFETRVAIPVSRQLENDGAIISKRLVTGGNMIVTTITGGTLPAHEALAALKTYIHDYQKVILAIPFESLVTNRLQEPDSARWITMVCYPIM
ncbi:MAG TPA: hypothetical protein VIU45_06550 [Chitinophagaceae bacterium]